MFDIEKSFAEWRTQMLAAGIKTPVPLVELENHLRDDVEKEMLSGSAAEEAFEKATRRIGLAWEISNEFDKTSKGQRSAKFWWIWLWIGSCGLAVTVSMNLVGRFVLHRGSSLFLSHQWWADWFPSYAVWISFTIIGSVIAIGRWRHTGIKVNQGLAVAAGASFILSYLLPAADDESGTSCFIECWRVLARSGRYQIFPFGWWSYYSGFVACNLFFVLLFVAILVRTPLVRARRWLSLALFLQVSSWAIVNHFSVWTMPLGIGYFIWLLSFVLLFGAHLVPDGAVSYSNFLAPAGNASPTRQESRHS
jgi:hypothetical protein